MAEIAGVLMMSHVPAIGGAIAKGVQQEPYWKPFFDGFPPVRDWLAKVKPDVAVMVYNDHGLNFFLDKMPTFALGVAPQYQNADEGWGIPVVPPFEGDEDLSWHLLESLVDAEFDPVSCQEMAVDHAFTLPLQLCWPDMKWPVRTVPVVVNTVQYPMPSAARCAKLGRTIGDAIRAWDSDARVVVFGTGGLSHQLEGERAGFINKPFDEKFMASMVDDPEWATQFSIHDIIEKTGTQGLELLNWLAARNTVPGTMRTVHSNYHIPISNTASALMALEPA
ncbi:MAG: class III extradiol dioxygenase family protein [Burkholderiaceae bacterium]